MATFKDFQTLDIRTGKIIRVDNFPEAKNPSYKIKIDFGEEIGIKNSSVQITENYSKEDLLGVLVLSVVNFPVKQIGPFLSEVLTLGVPDKNGGCILIKPDKEVPLGAKLY